MDDAGQVKCWELSSKGDHGTLENNAVGKGICARVSRPGQVSLWGASIEAGACQEGSEASTDPGMDLMGAGRE